MAILSGIFKQELFKNDTDPTSTSGYYFKSCSI